MMMGLLEFISVVTILATMGGLVWAGLGVISTSPEFAGGYANAESGAPSALIFAGIAFVVFILVGQIKKRLN